MSSGERERIPEGEGLVREVGSKAVFPVYINKWEEFQNNVRAWINIGTRDTLGKESSNLLQQVVDLSIGVLTPWLTHGGLVISVASEESFKRDIRRKITGVAETLRTLMVRELEACNEMLKALSVVSTKIYTEGVSPEMSKTEESIRKATTRCIEALRKTSLAVPSFLVATDIMLGSIQANLPASLMSNVIKGRVGFITD